MSMKPIRVVVSVALHLIVGALAVPQKIDSTDSAEVRRASSLQPRYDASCAGQDWRPTVENWMALNTDIWLMHYFFCVNLSLPAQNCTPPSPTPALLPSPSSGSPSSLPSSDPPSGSSSPTNSSSSLSSSTSSASPRGTNVFFNGNVSVPGNLTVNGNVIIQGNANVPGSISTNGSVISNGSPISNRSQSSNQSLVDVAQTPGKGANKAPLKERAEVPMPSAAPISQSLISGPLPPGSWVGSLSTSLSVFNSSSTPNAASAANTAGAASSDSTMSDTVGPTTNSSLSPSNNSTSLDSSSTITNSSTSSQVLSLRPPNPTDGLLQALATQYMPETDSFNCSYVMECDIASCEQIDPSQPDPKQAYWNLLRITNLSEIYRELYEALNQVSGELAGAQAMLVEVFSEATTVQSQKLLLEVLSACLVVVGILMLGFAPEIAGGIQAAPNLIEQGVAQLSKFVASQRATQMGPDSVFGQASRSGLGSIMVGSQSQPTGNLLDYGGQDVDAMANLIRPQSASQLDTGLGQGSNPALVSQQSNFIEQQAIDEETMLEEEASIEAQAASNAANPNSGKPIIPLNKATNATLNALSKAGGVLPTVAGMISIGLNKPDTTTINELANVATLIVAVSNATRDAVASDNLNLMAGQAAGDGRYVWDYLAGGAFLTRPTYMYQQMVDYLESKFYAMAINAIWKYDRVYIVGYPKQGDFVECNNNPAFSQAGAPNSSFFLCDENDPYFYYIYRFPTEDKAGLPTTRLEPPMGWDHLGQYNTTIQDVMRSSIKAYQYDQGMTYAANLTARWLENWVAGGADDPTQNAPDMEGVWTIPVCIAAPDMWIEKYESEIQLAYPCSCGGSAAGGNNYGNETNQFLAASSLNVTKAYNDLCGGGPLHRNGPPQGSAYIYNHNGHV